MTPSIKIMQRSVPEGSENMPCDSFVAHLGPALRAWRRARRTRPTRTPRRASPSRARRSCRTPAPQASRRQRYAATQHKHLEERGDILTLGISSTARRCVMIFEGRSAPSSISCIVNRPGLFPARPAARTSASCASPTNASKRCCVHRARGGSPTPRGCAARAPGRRRPPAR